MAGTIFDAVKVQAMHAALVEIRVLGEAGVLRDVDADESFSNSRQMALVLDALT